MKKLIQKFRMWLASRTPRWSNDLIMCPSQCYCKFWVDDKPYCIYMRWRWNDPWDVWLIERDENGQVLWESEWTKLNVGYFVHDNYEVVQKESIKIIKKYFKRKKISWV